MVPGFSPVTVTLVSDADTRMLSSGSSFASKDKIYLSLKRRIAKQTRNKMSVKSKFVIVGEAFCGVGSMYN